MKLIFRIIGIGLIAIATLLFLYGAVKTFKSEKREPSTIEIAPGIKVVQKDTQQEELANKGFQAAAVAGIAGLVLLLFNRRNSKRSAPAGSQSPPNEKTVATEPAKEEPGGDALMAEMAAADPVATEPAKEEPVSKEPSRRAPTKNRPKKAGTKAKGA